LWRNEGYRQFLVTQTAANMTMRGRRPRAHCSGVIMNEGAVSGQRVEGFGLFSCDVLGTGTFAGDVLA
jgi:hypothetical protein